MMARVSFGTKGETLETLRKHIQSARLPPFLLVGRERWGSDGAEVLTEIGRFLGAKKLIVRSSALCEDASCQSQAGHFLSVSGIDNGNAEKLKAAIDAVFSSYENSNLQEHVIVQEQLDQVAVSGVLFTREIDTLAPYYIVNYDESGSTSSVTSGQTAAKTYVRLRSAAKPPPVYWLGALLDLARELESLFPTG